MLRRFTSSPPPGAATPVAVSVVIPHHNAASTLVRALSSVTAQSVAAKEVLVVDDGSDPEHLSHAQAAVDSIPGARLITLSHNQGPATARNVGWAQATGDWLGFLDADDTWHPRKLELQLQAIRDAGPLDLVGTLMERAQPDAPWPEKTLNDSLPVRRVTRRALLVRNWFPTSTVLLRRALSSRFVAGERYCEDYGLWLLLAGSEAAKMSRIELPLARSNKRPFGEAGLSKDVASMMQGEVRAFRRARDARAMSATEYAWSTAVMQVRFRRQHVLHWSWQRHRERQQAFPDVPGAS